MPNVLFLCDASDDYGPDYLAHGFNALGWRVVDWPRKDALHTTADNFDCNVNLPEHGLKFDDLCEMLTESKFDLIVFPTLRGKVPTTVTWLRRKDLLKAPDRIVCYDAEDNGRNSLPLFTEILGFRPAHYFKRELPPGETWATPLPFGYPEERVQPLGDIERLPQVAYAVELWPWALGGLRDRLGEMIKREFGGRARVNMSQGGMRRLSVSQYHAVNRSCSVAVSPAGAGYHTNRHLEIIADGCAPVLELPWMQWPNAPADGEEAMYFRNEEDAVESVRVLLGDPARAHEMAKAAQRCLLAHHTTRRRAEQVVEVVGCVVA